MFCKYYVFMPDVTSTSVTVEGAMMRGDPADTRARCFDHRVQRWSIQNKQSKTLNKNNITFLEINQLLHK
jgi:hypothetical protein